MKHQTVRDRLNEGEGMVRHDMEKGRGVYRNEEERPAQPSVNHISAKQNMGYGMREFKGDADPIAYGQAASEGCKRDEERISSQFKDYHWG